MTKPAEIGRKPAKVKKGESYQRAIEAWVDQNPGAKPRECAEARRYLARVHREARHAPR